MVGTLVGSARKAGIIKNDKGNNIQYDNIILYLLIPVGTFKTDNFELSGYPVTIAEIKIKAKKFSEISNIPYADVPSKYGESLQVNYDLVSRNGSMVPTLSTVIFGGC